MLKKDYCNSKQLKPENIVRVEERRAKRKSFIKKMILFFVILILIIVIIYGLFFSSLFKINKIIITGLNTAGELNLAEQTVKDALGYKRFMFFSSQNCFFVNKKILENSLRRKLAIDEIEIVVQRPQTIKIEIKKNYPVAIWQGVENYYAVYSGGWIKSKILDIKSYELPIIGYSTTTEPILGGQYLNDKQVEYIDKLFALFSFYFKNGGLDRFEVASADSREIKLVLQDKRYILFSLDLDAEDSLKLTNKVMGEKASEIKSYVDVRIKDRIYYK